ncbi:MAG TPA: hypothetical protein VFH63_05105 [candidate division Zixibacteria bacterium]|nr:hypothetical protein [candidate division Zixibacteria bacterium]
MTVQLDCPNCREEVPFTVEEAADEIVCGVCSMRLDFAPDPVITFEILYQAA